MNESKIYLLIRQRIYSDGRDTVVGYTTSEQFAIDWVKEGDWGRDYEECWEILK